MFPLTDPEDLDEATHLINQYASSDWCRISYTRHAQERAQQRMVPADVVQNTLAFGNVVEARREEFSPGRVRYSYNVQLVDRYGRVNVVTAVVAKFHLVVVTTYADAVN